MINPVIYTQLISQYSSYFRCSPILNIDFNPSTSSTKVSIDFFFITHPYFHLTKLRVREWYDTNDCLQQYRYAWEVSSTPSGNISAWENEHDHDLPTDPHHHHHVPYDRHPVQANPNIRNLTDALNFVMPFIITGRSYP